MPAVKLTQETVLKHFIKRSDAITANNPYWLTEAMRNHQERGGIGVRRANTNTLLLVKPEVWDSIVDGSYFGDNHNPPPPNGQLALTIDKEDIDRIITTNRNNNYPPANEFGCEVTADLVGANAVSATFLCQYNQNDNTYTIVHFEGLGN